MRIEFNGFFGFLLLIADVYAIVKTLQSGAGTGVKVLWVVVILVVPLFGFILWLFLGPSDS